MTGRNVRRKRAVVDRHRDERGLARQRTATDWLDDGAKLGREIFKRTVHFIAQVATRVRHEQSCLADHESEAACAEMNLPNRFREKVEVQAGGYGAGELPAGILHRNDARDDDRISRVRIPVGLGPCRRAPLPDITVPARRVSLDITFAEHGVSSHRASVVRGEAANELVHVRGPELQRGHGSCQCGRALLHRVQHVVDGGDRRVGVVVGLPLRGGDGRGSAGAVRQANGDEIDDAREDETPEDQTCREAAEH